MQPTAERLRAALADLPVVVDAIACATHTPVVPSYGGPRPTTTVTLTGAGRAGHSEHVGWSDDAHAHFRAAAATAPRGGWRIGEWSRELAEHIHEPYDRAALEAAAIELALRQRATTLGALAGATPRPPRVVVSFERCADPVARAAQYGAAELKVDVDRAWPEAVWSALARSARVAVLDWKGTGDATAYALALQAFPAALHEDPAPPWPEAVRRRLSLDAALTTAGALAEAQAAACNLKPARMGGVLEALAAAAYAAEHGIATYVGGMFEVGVGRQQLRDLAALLCPEGPNDLAPIPLAEPATVS